LPTNATTRICMDYIVVTFSSFALVYKKTTITTS